jgi:hypothetical protein
VNALSPATPPGASSAANYYLSDLTWASATNGWGPIQKDKSIGGNTLSIRGVTFTKGIGAHAVSQIAPTT